MALHKFGVGQIVEFHPGPNERSNTPSGTYQITRQSPEEDSELMYRIKSHREDHERTARESQLAAV
jgi:hypothetical protein